MRCTLWMGRRLRAPAAPDGRGRMFRQWKDPMKLALLLALVLVAVIVARVLHHRRASRAARRAAARMRERAAARRNRVPAVSSNVKGVTASQTIDPYRPGEPQAGSANDRNA